MGQDSRNFQRIAAIAGYLVGASIPLGFLACDLLRGKSPPLLNYLIPAFLLMAFAAVASRRPFGPFIQVTIVLSLVTGFVLTLFLPYARDAYLLLFFCFPSIAFLTLGPRLGLAASAAFLALASSLGLALMLGALPRGSSVLSPTILAMGTVAYVILGAIAAVTEHRHRRQIDRLVERRYFDAETGLPNAEALGTQGLGGGSTLFAVHVSNLRDLAVVCPREAARDIALRAKEALASCLEEAGGAPALYRASENEFYAILAPGSDPKRLTRRILEALSSTPAVPGTPLRFVARVASYRPSGAESPRELLGELSAALSDCLASQAPCLHRDRKGAEDGEKDLRRRAPALIRTIDERRFVPMFQPVYDLERGGIGFLEALIRLESDGRPVSPERYLDAAFRLGLDSHLTSFILEAAVSTARESGHSVSLNATYRDITRPCFKAALKEALRSLAGGPAALIVEITEQARLDNANEVIGFVDFVHAEGGLVFLDDFGSGYSNYASLLATRFDAVKAAGEIVKEIAIRSDAYKLYRGMTAFCAEAGIPVVAEHISDESVMGLAVAGGARFLQGYHFSAPVTAERIRTGEFAFPEGYPSLPTPVLP